MTTGPGWNKHPFGPCPRWARGKHLQERVNVPLSSTVSNCPELLAQRLIKVKHSTMGQLPPNRSHNTDGHFNVIQLLNNLPGLVTIIWVLARSQRYSIAGPEPNAVKQSLMKQRQCAKAHRHIQIRVPGCAVTNPQHGRPCPLLQLQVSWQNGQTPVSNSAKVRRPSPPSSVSYTATTFSGIGCPFTQFRGKHSARCPGDHPILRPPEPARSRIWV